MANSVVTFRGYLDIPDATLENFLEGLAVDEYNTRRYEVADSTSDESINFAGLTTATAVLLRSDQTVSFKINGGDTAIQLTANGLFVLFNTSITSLTISNSSGSTANVTVVLAGT